MLKKISMIQGVLLMLASFSFSAVPDRVIVIGKVKNIFTDSVVIQTKTGAIKVPRSTVAKQDSLKEGMTAKAELTFSQLMEAKK